MVSLSARSGSEVGGRLDALERRVASLERILSDLCGEGSGDLRVVTAVEEGLRRVESMGGVTPEEGDVESSSGVIRPT